MRKRRVIIALLPAVLVIAVAGLFRWLLFTESGADFIWQRIAGSVPGELQVERIEGALKTRLRLSGLSYREGSLRVAVDRAELRLDLDLWPLALSVGELRLGTLEIDLPQASSGPQDPAANLEALALAFPVEIEQVDVQRLALSEAGGESVLEITGLLGRVDWFKRLRVDRIQADFPQHGLRLEGRGGLGFARPFDTELDIRLTGGPGSLGADVPLRLQAQASGDLDLLKVELALEQPELRLSGSLADVLGVTRWDALLESPRLAWPLGTDPADWVLEGLELSAYGDLERYDIEGTAVFQGGGLTRSDLRVLGAGDPGGIVLERLAVEGDVAVASGSGSLRWDTALAVAAQLDLARLDPRPWWPDWGEAPPVSGRVELAWSEGRLQLSRVDLAAPGTVQRLEGSASVDLEGGGVSAQLDWLGLAWPPGADEPTLRSDQGNGRLDGSLDDWRFDGELSLAGRDVPEGSLRLAVRGDREQLGFEAPSGEVLGGRFAALGTVRWAPRLEWEADATLEKLQTGPLRPDFPGFLSGRIAASGRAVDDRIDLRFERLSGVVRDRPLDVQGALSFVGGRVEADRLSVRSSDSTVTLHGSPQSADGLESVIRIASLGDLVDEASGRLEGQAWLRRMGKGAPELRVDLQGEDLSWAQWTLGSLAVRSGSSGAGDLLLELADLDGPDGRVDALRVESSGDALLERVRIEARLPGGEVDAELDQGRADWSRSTLPEWQGRLARLQLESAGPAGAMELETPVPLQIGGAGLGLEGACLRGPREGRVCLELTLQSRGERIVQASLERISPNMLLSFSGYGLLLSHRITGTAGWRQLPGARATARVDVAISAGDLRFEGEEQPVLQTGAGYFGFAVEEGRLHGGQLELPLETGGGVNMDFAVPDLSQGLDAPVQGRLVVELPSIEPLLELTASLEGESGPLTADMRFSGTLGDPRFTGYMSLVRGRILHYPSGLLLQDLQLAGAVYQFDQTDLRGTFRAGDGQGSVRAVMNFGDMLAPGFQVELKGENLRLVDVPDLRIEANPDLRLSWKQDTLQIDGRVQVPSARLSPRYLPTASVSESADAVIVAGVDPLADREVEELPDWNVRGSLALELGRDVELVLDRARARLTGKTQFTWAGPPVPTADGSFRLTGEINAYGQLLEIEEGRVSFSGRPADDPFLNIRAEREIFGNSQVRTAGVLVTGSLSRPVLEPYTVPMTTRERALALLVTGSDFDYEQGVGSVQVGMYVAPKLFISYGVGLFDDQNVISARYDLGKGFSVRATSGQRETGVDFDYTVER